VVHLELGLLLLLAMLVFRTQQVLLLFLLRLLLQALVLEVVLQ
jgi:hypothetical protein